MNAELKTYKDLDAWKDLGLLTLDYGPMNRDYRLKTGSLLPVTHHRFWLMTDDYRLLTVDCSRLLCPQT